MPENIMVISFSSKITQRIDGLVVNHITRKSLDPKLLLFLIAAAD